MNDNSSAESSNGDQDRNDSVPQAFRAPEPPFIPEPMRAPPGQAPESFLGKRLARAREHYRLKIEALSRLTKSYDVHEGRGISPPSLTRYESGESAPGAREIRLLCEALQVSPHWLVLGEIDAAGSSDTEQKLLAVLKDFVNERITAAAMQPQTEGAQWIQDLDRANKLAEARKPS